MRARVDLEDAVVAGECQPAVDAHKLRAAGERGGPECREHAGRWADCERIQPRVLARVAAADVELCAGRVRSPVAERAYGLRPLPVRLG